MNTEAMFYMFGPLVVFTLIASIVFGVNSYVEFKKAQK
jgi:hypothetical protein